MALTIQTMTPEAIQDLVSGRLHSEAHFTVCPDILPSNQIQRIRQIHGAWLPDDEPVLALYDDTLLGTGADGFALTTRRLLWRNFLGHARQLLWSDLDSSAVELDSDDLVIAESRLSTGALTQKKALSWLIQELGDRHRGGELPVSGPTTGINPAVVVKLARWLIGERPAVFYAPAFPHRKEKTVRRVHDMPSEERVLVIIDDTIFGSAAEGIALTDRRICWKHLLDKPRSMQWSAIKRQGIPCELQLTLQPDLLVPIIALITEISDEMSSITGRVYCWSCRGEVRLVGGRCGGCGQTLITEEGTG